MFTSGKRRGDVDLKRAMVKMGKLRLLVFLAVGGGAAAVERGVLFFFLISYLVNKEHF